MQKTLQTTTSTQFHLIWHIHQVSQSSVHIIAALFHCNHDLKLSILSENDNPPKYNIRRIRRTQSPDCMQNSFYAFHQEILMSIRMIKTSECPVVPRHETECQMVPRHERKCSMMESHERKCQMMPSHESKHLIVSRHMTEFLGCIDM